MPRILLVLLLLATPLLSDARDPRGRLDKKAYGSESAKYDAWLYVPILGISRQVTGAQIMSPAETPAPGCSAPSEDAETGEPVLACYPHMSVWCQAGKTTLLMLAPEAGKRFARGPDSVIHWNIDDHLKGRWTGFYQIDNLSRMGQREDSRGTPGIQKLMGGKALRIEHRFEGEEGSYYTYSLSGFADAVKKCKRATIDSSRIYELLDIE